MYHPFGALFTAGDNVKAKPKLLSFQALASQQIFFTPIKKKVDSGPDILHWSLADGQASRPKP
jgi:hypothetical protein